MNAAFSNTRRRQICHTKLVSGNTRFSISFIRCCSSFGGIGISMFFRELIPTVFWAVPVATFLHCSNTKGVDNQMDRKSESNKHGFNKAICRWKQKSESVWTATTIPYEPVTVNNISFLLGILVLANASKYERGTNLVLEKSISPEDTSEITRKGTPFRVWGGGWWSPSAILLQMDASLTHCQESGISNGISSSMQRSLPANFS